jgi:hypothetical protein
MSFLLVNVGRGRHLGIVLLAWIIFFWLAACVLPPLDSHVKSSPLVFWIFLIVAVVLALSSVIVIPAYVYQSRLKLPTAPNRTLYGLWVGLESLIVVGLPICFGVWLLTKFL